jgi:hypothetical protein
VKPHEEALGEFSESELAKLTLPAVEINCWNPLNNRFSNGGEQLHPEACTSQPRRPPRRDQSDSP